MVEQGLSFTVLVTSHPFEGDAGEGKGRPEDFHEAHRVWLGSGLRGTDWLHEEVEAALVPSGNWLTVDSERRSTHVGASGEIATVIVVLMGAGALNALRTFTQAFGQRLGEGAADALLEWARQRAREREPSPHDGPPDFYLDDDPDRLAQGLGGELAQLVGGPAERIELVSAERRDGTALQAVYRDTQTGHEYTAGVGRDCVTFERLSAPELPTESRRRLPWRR